MSDNWVVGNLQNALDTWNAKVTELWNLILTSPQNFKGGGIWTAITNVNTAMQALGTGLLVLFFVIGVVKTCGSFTDLKKPEHAVKLFVRFILAKAVITQGMELMTTLFGVVQSGIASIMTAAGVSSATDTVLPDDLDPATNGQSGTKRKPCRSISANVFSASCEPTPLPPREAGTSVCTR